MARLLSSEMAFADFLGGVRYSPELERERTAPVSREAIRRWQWSQRYAPLMPVEPGMAPMVESASLAEQISFTHEMNDVGARILARLEAQKEDS